MATRAARRTADAPKSIGPVDAIERASLDKLVPYARNARTHSDQQIAQIAASISEWGWTMPVLVDEGGGIIAGHARVLAARRLGMTEAPVVIARGWSDAKKRAYVLADNKLAMNSDPGIGRLWRSPPDHRWHVARRGGLRGERSTVRPGRRTGERHGARGYPSLHSPSRPASASRRKSSCVILTAAVRPCHGLQHGHDCSLCCPSQLRRNYLWPMGGACVGRQTGRSPSTVTRCIIRRWPL